MTNKLQNLQVLRGIAAILVCCFHARSFLNGKFNYGDILFNQGSIGVPVFFIISGFIMVFTTSHLQQHTSIQVKSFFIKRIVRVAPLYYVLTIGMIFIMHSWTHYISMDGIVELIKVFLFIPTGSAPPLYVGWTLNYEMFFYLIFGLALFFSKKRYFILYLVLLFLVFIAPMLLNELIVFDNRFKNCNSNYFEMITSPLLLQFLLGVFLGNTYELIKLKKNMVLVFLVASSGLFICYYFNAFKFPQSDIVICGILVFSVLHFDKSNSRFVPHTFFSYLGDISYSIYLVHPLVIIYLPGVLAKIGLTDLVHSKLLFLVIFVSVILCSIISYEIIEKRFTIFLKNGFLKKMVKVY